MHELLHLKKNIRIKIMKYNYEKDGKHWDN